MKYLLSVIIPTKNRYMYLKECLKTLVLLQCDDLEIVIQDNSDNNAEILAFIEKINCKHIKYFYNKRKLTQTENSELAVENSTGEYVCYIGDDDSISAILPQLVKLIKKYGIESLNCDMSTFYWNDVNLQNIGVPALSFKKNISDFKYVNSKKMLYEALQKGFQSIGYLPRAYHAVIARTILNNIKKRCGVYFPGPSPDMANAVACSLIVSKQICIKLPLIISGACYQSACGMGMRGAHKGGLKGVSQIADDVEDKWNEKIPKLWLGNTIWPESAIKALEAMGEESYIKNMNWNAMYGRILLKYSEYRVSTLSFIHGINYILLIFNIVKDSSAWLIDKVCYKIRRLIGKQYESNGNKISLQDACNITNSFLNEACSVKEIDKQMKIVRM